MQPWKDKAIIVSLYQKNITQDVLDAQSKVVKKFLPDGCVFQQLLSTSHAGGIDQFLANTTYESYLFLDIDCVPLNDQALSWAFDEAAAHKLVGCAQRANHFDNNEHIYAGPFALCFTKQLYDQIGRPSFHPTDHGDVGEELTFKCEASGIPVILLWPSHICTPKWNLSNGRVFGYGTTYENHYFHAFCIRTQETKSLFLNKCNDLVP